MEPDRATVRWFSPRNRAMALAELVFLAIFLAFCIVMLSAPLHHPLELWDESYYANTVIEMATRGHWLVPTYNWLPDHWSTKPPLFFWIAAGLERLGMRPLLAMRLPSAVAALSTVAVVYLFCRNVLGRPLVAITAALLTMSSTLFFGLHVAMSGDLDALLSVFTTVFVLAFFSFAELRKNAATTAIVVASLALACAVLTKGVAALLLLPGLLLYALLPRHARRSLFDPRLWTALGCIAITVTACYLGREHLDHGYLRAVWQNDLGGRFGHALEQHTGPWNSYLQLLFPARSIAQLLGLAGLAGLALTLHRPSTQAANAPSEADRSRHAALCMVCVIALFLSALSIARTKLWWYAAPAVPLLSILAALGGAELLRLCSLRSAYRMRWLQTIAFALLLGHLWHTVHRSIRDTRGTDAGAQANFGAALEQLNHMRNEAHDTSPVLLIDHAYTSLAGPDFDPVADFYAKASTRQGMPARRLDWPPPNPANTWLVVCDPQMIGLLQQANLLVHSA